jgi:prepilin-type N-terminal cleavage/methylation domain-containing protein
MTVHPQSAIRQPPRQRRAFTVMELLIVIMIIGLLVGLSIAAYVGAAEQARASRTRAIVNKLDQLITAKYDSYLTRRLPIRTTGLSPQIAGAYRLNGLHELMRMELPDRVIDVTTAPQDIDPRGTVTYTLTQPALHRAYQRKVNASWTASFQGSECLYLIVSTMQDGDKNAIDFFSPDELGDTDGDGMIEILDGWGNPIEFLRWAPGYSENAGPDGQWGVSGSDDDGNGTADDLPEAGYPTSDDVVPPTLQSRKERDPYDPLRLVPGSFALKPLIVSPGRDDQYDINTEDRSPIYNAHYMSGQGTQAGNIYGMYDGTGALIDPNGDGSNGALDNITNHYQEPQP